MVLTYYKPETRSNSICLDRRLAAFGNNCAQRAGMEKDPSILQGNSAICPEHLQNNPMNNSELAGSGIRGEFRHSSPLSRPGFVYPLPRNCPPRNLRRIVFLLFLRSDTDAALAFECVSFFLMQKL
ncbi:hypothetical protein CEXT_298671 [Caerostris extrusa]|uniref:Uncharacterized protein n=1 Tax=Caerostris extrusa TaxID=172846 RepID=A0AAV4T6D8_CAEEX|nr:hypothetical protein CEXT_298671 [Caerostris extrusa]